MSHAIEPAFSVHLPGGNRFCADEAEVRALLRQYMAARPDDPLLARVSVYGYLGDSEATARPLRLERFISDLGEKLAAPGTRARRVSMDGAKSNGDELVEANLRVLRDERASRRDRIQAASWLARHNGTSRELV